MRPVAAALRRFPYLAGVAAGLAWWLLLRPSALGCLIVVASLAAAWMKRRKTRRAPPDDPERRGVGIAARSRPIGRSGGARLRLGKSGVLC